MEFIKDVCDPIDFIGQKTFHHTLYKVFYYSIPLRLQWTLHKA